ncbi:conjugal transfer protein TrbL family protein [Priestia megaterium]|uniref:conjugal transfer protein TrbL family protein n=1 Tax=Priestia megaterium TaxID=1404 RepID=UPI001292CE1F|nr:conjugal transfer protein TrbL family protein [Priestia megaterium]
MKKKSSLIFIAFLIPFLTIHILTSFAPIAHAENPVQANKINEQMKENKEKKAEEKKEKEQKEKEKKKKSLDDYKKDCSTLDVSCHFDNLIISFTYTANQLFESMLTTFVINPTEITGDATIDRFYVGFQGLTGVLLVCFFIFKLLQGLTLQMTENDNYLIKEAIKRAIVASIFVIGMKEVFTKSLEAQKYIIQGIAANHDPSATGLLHLLALSPTGMFALMTLLYSILFLVIGIQYVIRWAELSLMYVLLPVVVPTIMNDEHNYFSSWVRQFIVILATQCIQTLLIAIMFRLQESSELFNVSNVSDFGKNIKPFIFSFGYAWLIYKTPAFVKELTYSTGASSAGKAGASKVLTYLMFRRSA